MKNVNNLYKNTSMKLSTVAVVLLSALGVSTLANAANDFINASSGTETATVGISKDVAVGRNAKANEGNTDTNTGGSTSVGADTKASGSGATALGYGANATGSYNSALGNQANASGTATTAVGVSSKASGAYSAALGVSSKATNTGSIGIGLATDADAGATGSGAVSIGSQAGASIQDSVALGSNSKTTVNSGVQGYDPSTGSKTDATWQATKGAVSVGDVDNNITRQITSVAAGTKDTDAVNVAQLKSLDGKVEKNKADIATNKADIATNKADIATNKADIATNKADIATNKADIATNKADIATNKADIATNKADIATNKADIATNKADIATNKADIATINSRLAANNNSINELRGNVNLLNKDLRGGVASAIAHASVPQSTKAGAIGVGVGTGFYGGQSAVSLGVSGVTPNENWVFKASVSTNSRGNYGVGAGALYQW